jgi:signal transduction histidine kinase
MLKRFIILRQFLLVVCLLVAFTSSAQQMNPTAIDTLVDKAKTIYYSNPNESMVMAREIVESSRLINYEMGEFEGIRLIGNSHFLVGRLDSAVYYMLQLLDLAYNAQNTSMQADVMIDIGQVYDKIGLNALAYDYFEQAHAIRLRIGDAERLSVTFINLAYHYFIRDLLDSALYYYKQTEMILDTIPLTFTKPFLYNELGGLYLKQGRIPEAREKIQMAMDLNIQLNNSWDLAFNYVTLAQLELQSGKLEAAEQSALKALSISEQSGISIEFDLIYKILSDVYAIQGKSKEALDYLQRSYVYSDSLELALTDQQVFVLDYYKKQKENEIETLELVNENLSQKGKLTNQRYLIVAIALVLILAVIAVGLLVRKNKQITFAQNRIQSQNEDLKVLNSTKNKLFSIITHDIRNPLGNIVGMLKLAKDGDISPEEFNDYAGTLADQTDRLTNLSETLINWSKSQQGGFSVNKQPVELDELITESIRFVEYMAADKQLSVVYNKSMIDTLLVDSTMLMLSLNNLLTNAIKFSETKSEITINTLLEGDDVVIEVSDTGIGIEDDLITQLKEGKVMQQVGTRNEGGTGIGLLLTLDMLTLNGAQLLARRNDTKGSTFSIRLPLSS